MTPNFQMIETNGIRLRAHVEGEGPLVVMVHGFPESWYSWRHVIPDVVAAGFQVAAIDVRGYGGSDKPQDVNAYGMEQITADVAGVAKALGHEKAILMGHDWGAPIVWNTSLVFPDIISAVAGLSVPHMGHGQRSFIDVAEAVYTSQGKFFYQVYFQDIGVAEKEFEADVRTCLRKLYYMWSGDGIGFTSKDKKHGEPMLTDMIDPDPFPAWMSDADMDYYIGEFTQSGFFGPLSKYRCMRADHEFMGKLDDHVIHQPSLFIAGERDGVLKMAPGMNMMDLMKPNMSDLRGAHMIPKVGHWTQQEAPEETTRLLVDWLKSL